jgi:hypothetical protein
MLMLAAGQAGAAIVHVCPDKIHVDTASIRLEDVPPGYEQGVATGPLWLSGIGISDGAPEQGARLKPLNADASGSKMVWRFSREDAALWLVCDYAGGVFQLSVRLKQPVSECRAVLEKSGMPKVLHARFACKER